MESKAEKGRKRAAEWRKKNPEHSRRNGVKSHYLRKWGMTLEEVDARIEAQDGVCKLCLKPDPRGIRLCIDHDHETGAFRGMLCTQCNWTLLGGIGDNPEFYERVVKYLRGTLD